MADERQLEELKAERAETVAALRRVCDEFGDNDWPDELHLGDVVEKHLRRHLHSDAMERRAGRER